MDEIFEILSLISQFVALRDILHDKDLYLFSFNDNINVESYYPLDQMFRTFPTNGMLGFTILSDLSKEAQDDHWNGKFRIHIFRF